MTELEWQNDRQIDRQTDTQLDASMAAGYAFFVCTYGFTEPWGFGDPEGFSSDHCSTLLNELIPIQNLLLFLPVIQMWPLCSEHALGKNKLHTSKHTN